MLNYSRFATHTIWLSILLEWLSLFLNASISDHQSELDRNMPSSDQIFFILQTPETVGI